MSNDDGRDDDDPFAVFGDDDGDDDDEFDSTTHANSESCMQVVAKSLVDQVNNNNKNKNAAAAGARKYNWTDQSSSNHGNNKESVSPLSSSATNKREAFDAQQRRYDSVFKIPLSSLPHGDDDYHKFGGRLLSSWPRPWYLTPNATVVSSNLDCYGGGRGMVATSTISAGTLIMVEEALVSWPLPNMVIDLDLVAFLLSQQQQQNPNSHKPKFILHAIEHLYPTKIEVDKLYSRSNMDSDATPNNGEDPKVSPRSTSQPHDTTHLGEVVQNQIKDMISLYDVQIGPDSHAMDNLLQFAKQQQQPQQGGQEHQQQQQSQAFGNSDGTPLTRLDILRILLALRYNSLETGIFLFSAMLNHDSVPNCVKFKASPQPSSTLSSSLLFVSEIRAIRTIEAGEPLTISYLPKLLSHSSRRLQLWDHHRFDIGVSFAGHPWLREMELIGNRLPPSNIRRGQTLWNQNNGDDHNDDDDDHKDNKHVPIQRRIETAIRQLEEELEEILSHGQPIHNDRNMSATAKTPHPQKARDSSPDSSAITTFTTSHDPSVLWSLPPEELERAQALEIATQQLCTTAQEQLQNPTHVLLLACREFHLQSCDLILQQEQVRPTVLSKSSSPQHKSFFGRLIVTALHLWQLQEMVYGRDYFALAQTLLELAQAVEQLLSKQASYLTTSTGLVAEIPDAIPAWLHQQHPRGMPSSRLSANNISAWTTLEYYARTQHERIKALYPRDVEEFVSQQQQQRRRLDKTVDDV
ncbi:hypothetical protein ACA910_020052 [Epithemia clementina (nom. ined.)]